VRLQEDTLTISVTTIEALPQAQVNVLEQNLSGPQFKVVANDAPGSTSRWRSDVEIDVLAGDPPGLKVAINFDPGFLELYRSTFAGTADSDAAFELASVVTSVLQGELGRGQGQFSISAAQYRQDGQLASLQFTLKIAANALKRDAGVVAESLSQENAIDRIEIEELGWNTHRFTLEIRNHGALDPHRDALTQARAREIQGRLALLLPDTPLAYGLVTESYLRLADVLAATPFYVTIPENTPRSGYREREYEYFFASKTLEIATDIFGFAIIIFILFLERRGVIHRSGAEEDLHR
jgi:hypothetical protein